MENKELWHALTKHKKGDISGFQLVKLRFEQSEYFIDSSCFEAVILCSSYYRKSPWNYGFVRQAPKNTLVLIPQTQGGKRFPSSEKVRSAASLAFKEMKSLDEKSTHTKKKGSDNAYGILQRKNDQVVQTPPSILSALDLHFRFDCDPCPIKPQRDAMTSEWGFSNFINPPFRHARAFLERASFLAQTQSKTSLVLVPVPFKTQWFSHVLQMNCIKKVWFLRSGIVFVGYKNACPYPLCLIEIGPGASAASSGSYSIGFDFWDPSNTIRRKRPTCEEKTSFKR